MMTQAYTRHEMRARLPPTPELLAAWRNFFSAKLKRKEAVLDTQTPQLLVTFRAIQKAMEYEELRQPFTPSDYLDALRVLALRPDMYSLTADVHDISKLHTRPDVKDPSFLDLATELWKAVQQPIVGKDVGKEQSDEQQEYAKDAFFKYITILTNIGRPESARDLLVERTMSSPKKWSDVLYAYAAANDAAGFEESVSMVKDLHPETYQVILPELVEYRCNMEQMETAKTQFAELREDGLEVSPRDNSRRSSRLRSVLGASQALINLCIRQQDLETGQTVVQYVMSDLLPVSDTEYYRSIAWVAVFSWAIGSGKSVEELDRMLKMAHQNDPQLPIFQIYTSLLAFAVKQKNPYLAERIFSAGQAWGLSQPSIIDYAYIIQSRLQADDVESAKAAFARIQGQELPREMLGQEPIIADALNALISSFCALGDKVPKTDVMLTVDELIKQNGSFALSTIQALCALHLRADEFYEVTDLLKTHAPKLPSQDRIALRDTLFNFCLDRTNPIQRVWDTFVIFHQLFEMEANRELFSPIMNEFYQRGKPEMGTHVFNVMRDHHRPNMQATEDTYVDALAGAGQCTHAESLHNIHNQLKLDVIVDPTTRICNALMLAYHLCGHPNTAWTFWRQIISSVEGPSFESILIVLRACERIPFGEQRAVAIWRQFQSLDIEVTPPLLASFIGALAANDMVVDCKELITSAKENYGVEPDELM